MINISFFILIISATVLRFNYASEWEKFVAASTNDMGRLADEEIKMIDKINTWMYQLETGKTLMRSEEKHDWSLMNQTLHSLNVEKWKFIDSKDYVSHPINAFHLLKRTTTIWPNLYENITSLSLENLLEDHIAMLPDADDFNYGACVGLINIEAYYNIGFLEMAQGIVRDPEGGQYQAIHRLTSEDCLLIANAAKRVWKIDKMVDWTEAALTVAANLENKSKLELRLLQKKVDNAKLLHDDLLLKYGVNSLQKMVESNVNAPDSQPSAPFFTKTQPYDEELLDVPSYRKSVKKYKKELAKSQPFVNWRARGDDHNDGRFMDKSFYRMRTTMLEHSKRLCQGDASARNASMDANLRCKYLHYFNPFLRLGPFKYEPLNDDPHIGIMRDFYNQEALDHLIADSHDKLHSTTFMSENGIRYYTSQRSSKRRHIDDEESDLSLKLSTSLSLATRWIVHQSYLASEHYHLINYGIGGQIEVHVDYWGPGNYDPHPGGDRTVTFLGYGSTPKGGYTIFPALGTFVKPNKGDALFWLTLTNDRDYDSRMFHMGCPVVYGHKWVLTKWLYSDDQMFMHPCMASSSKGDNFPSFGNHQRFHDKYHLDLDE